MNDELFYKSVGYNDAIADAKELVRKFYREKFTMKPSDATMINLKLEELRLGYEQQLKVNPTDVNPVLHP